MKICVIHGSPRKGNNFKVIELFKKNLLKFGDIEFTDFFLPKDMPHFCIGCYNCIEKSEEKCPHFSYMKPITETLKEADAFIFSSPVYVLAESGGMKALLDHFGYMFIPHRPVEEMFSKVGIVISTAAGSGNKYPLNSMKRNLSFWGLKRVLKMGFSILAKDWEDMNIKRQKKFENIIEKKAKKFYLLIEKRNELSVRPFTKIMFFFMKKMISNYNEDSRDKIYWKEKGWLSSSKKPYKK